MDSYWIERAERLLLEGDKTTAELLKRMKTTYRGSLKSIQKEIEAFYGRYAINNKLDLTEVKKRLNPEELKSAKEEIQKYYELAKPELIGKNMSKQYRQELRLQSAKAYMSRLEELKLALRNEVILLGGAEELQFTDSLSQAYNNAYEKTAYNVNTYTGFSTGFESLNNEKLSKAISEKWLEENYSDRIWKNKQKLLNELETTLLQGIAQGHNSKKIAQKMAENYGTSYKNCERLARTEVGHIAGQATLASYKKTNVDKYEFVATLDLKTSHICQSLDGKVFLLKEAQEGVNYPEMHPNCRSTTAPYFEPDEIDKMFEKAERSARDENGKIYYIPSDITYEEWSKKVKK